MNAPLALLATLVTMVALYLPTRTQAFTRVTIDGRTMRMLVEGSGNATVVFENGAGAPLEMWGKVQPAVSRFAKTVSYDRAGVGLSDGPAARDGRRVATELHRALEAAGIAPPYVLVGASVGGLHIRVFAGMYPDDVAGMVLVDPTPDGEEARASHVPDGIPVWLIDSVSPAEVPFASAAVRSMRRRNRPEIEADSREYRRWLAAIPGARIITTSSGHNIGIEEPGLVVETIRQMVDTVNRDVAAGSVRRQRRGAGGR
jgi:pimeloyl-ACP methyl ester carboxylesterase